MQIHTPWFWPIPRLVMSAAQGASYFVQFAEFVADMEHLPPLSNNNNLHIPSQSPPGTGPIASSSNSRTLRRSSVSNSSKSSIAVTRRSKITRQASKVPTAKLRNSAQERAKRAARIAALRKQAAQIGSVDNSVVNVVQGRLQADVYFGVTRYPPEYWQLMMAVLIDR